MNYEIFEKQTKLFGQIKELDLQISELNEFAIQVANDDRMLLLNIKFKNLENKTPLESFFDNITRGELSQNFTFIVSGHEIKNVKMRSSINEILNELNDVETLYIIESILKIKNKKRAFMHSELEALNENI